MEAPLPMVGSIKAARAVPLGAAAVPPDLMGPWLQGSSPLRPYDHGGLRHGRHGARRAAGARSVDAGQDLRALLGFGPRVPKTLAPVLAPGPLPAPGSSLGSRGFSAASCHTLALPASQSAPAAAPGAQTVATVVEGRAGGPLAAFGPGRHCPGSPV
jgi:hypothetical protein